MNGIDAILARKAVRLEQVRVNLVGAATGAKHIRVEMDEDHVTEVTALAELTTKVIADLNLGFVMKTGFTYKYTLVKDAGTVDKLDGKYKLEVHVTKTNPVVSEVAPFDTFHLDIHGITKHNYLEALKVEQAAVNALVNIN